MSTRGELAKRGAMLLLGVAALGAVGGVAWLIGERAALDSERVALQGELSDREAEVAELQADLEELDRDLREETERRAALRDELAELRSTVTALEAELDLSAEEVHSLEEQLAEMPVPAEEQESSVSSASPWSPPASSELSACDQLGGFHDLGEQGCAELIASIEECQRMVDSDPDWVQFDGALYENVVTGEVTFCDV